MKYEKDLSMTETHRLKNAIILIQTILSFLLSRKIIKIFNSTSHKKKKGKKRKEQKHNPTSKTFLNLLKKFH